ncbi:hypothetical protein L5B71_07405 [Avibacterium sp. 21-586]|uniref:hypothetical protein n=1 Tax=Avibacterium sp. 21-586 TaxID=2911534 RepID=UPI0022456E2F|nr:hypothetical protein [Avibacterium sp. 21-586]MCW9710673.1 hypothetical protein [Avibacterium sp. 21-586]
MKFRFLYAEWQEDEGAEIEMHPRLGLIEKNDMPQEKRFKSFMAGYFDFKIFIETQLSEVKHIEDLEKQLEEAKKAGIEEITFYVKEYYPDDKEVPAKFVINANETKFFNPIDNEANPNHFDGTAIPTELFLALLKEWKIYIESGSQEEKIVDIPFDYDETLYRSTGKIQRKQ